MPDRDLVAEMERAPVRRLGRRLLRGRWRPTRRMLEETAPWRGNAKVLRDNQLAIQSQPNRNPVGFQE